MFKHPIVIPKNVLQESIIDMQNYYNTILNAKKIDKYSHNENYIQLN